MGEEVKERELEGVWVGIRDMKAIAIESRGLREIGERVGKKDYHKPQVISVCCEIWDQTFSSVCLYMKTSMYA